MIITLDRKTEDKKIRAAYLTDDRIEIINFIQKSNGVTSKDVRLNFAHWGKKNPHQAFYQALKGLEKAGFVKKEGNKYYLTSMVSQITAHMQLYKEVKEPDLVERYKGIYEESDILKCAKSLVKNKVIKKEAYTFHYNEVETTYNIYFLC